MKTAEVSLCSVFTSWLTSRSFGARSLALHSSFRSWETPMNELKNTLIVQQVYSYFKAGKSS